MSVNDYVTHTTDCLLSVNATRSYLCTISYSETSQLNIHIIECCISCQVDAVSATKTHVIVILLD